MKILSLLTIYFCTCLIHLQAQDEKTDRVVKNMYYQLKKYNDVLLSRRSSEKDKKKANQKI